MNPCHWFGNDYKPVLIGLQHDRFVEFYHCIELYHLPMEIFKMLCECWLIAEVLDAKHRLNRYRLPK